MQEVKNEKLRQQYESLIKSIYNDCRICHDPLQFSYFIDYAKHRIKEIGTCNKCKTHLSIVQHVLH